MEQSHLDKFTVERTHDDYIVWYFDGVAINDCKVKWLHQRVPEMRCKNWFTPEMESKSIALCGEDYAG